MKRIHVDIVGLGDFELLHLTALSRFSYEEVTRVCSRTPARAAEIAAHLKIPAVNTDREACAWANDVDVVSVVTVGPGP